MDVPDYVSPIIGYRCWWWNGSRLLSLNDQPWPPGYPLIARCSSEHLASIGFQREFLRLHYKEGPHQAPQTDCTCGIYALKADGAGGWPFIKGEVYLWGTVVEHSHGYRAQFAYPKRLVVSAPYDFLLDGGRGSFSVEEVRSRLESLTKYRADIFLANGIRVWTASSGYNPAGIEGLREIPRLPLTNRELELLLGHTPRGLLSPREFELLPFLCQGLKYREIGMHVGLATPCVKNYMLSIFDKLGVANRIELVQLVLVQSGVSRAPEPADYRPPT